MFRYVISGLSVASDIALAGMIASGADDSEQQVSMRYAAVPVRLEAPSQTGLTWEMMDGRVLFRVPDVARFLISDGREILIEAEHGIGPGDLAVFLAGTVFGILLHQRRQVAIHASAVMVGGKAVLFCGVSGAGKSTLAAELSARGYPLLSDDICAIDAARAGEPLAFPDGRSLKLWRDAVARLGAAPGDAVRPGIEKYYVAPASSAAEPAPIGAVYALREQRPPLAFGIERPNIVDAAAILRRNAYRALMVHQMDQRPLYFEAAGAVARAAGFYHLTRPLRFDRMGGVIALLEKHWAAIGLARRAA